MRIDSYAQLQQAQAAGEHITLNRQGRLETQSAFSHVMQKVSDFFRCLTSAGKAAVRQRNDMLRAAMDDLLRQSQVVNPAKTEIARPAPRAEASAAAQKPENLDLLMSEVYDMVTAETSHLLSELDEDVRNMYAMSAVERMHGFLQDADLSGGVNRAVLRDIVSDVVRDVAGLGFARTEAPKTDAPKTEAPKTDAPKTGATADARGAAAPGAALSVRHEQVNAMVADVVRARFGMLPQQERAKIEADVKQQFAAIKNLEERVPDDAEALSEAVDFCARAKVRHRAVQKESGFVSLSRELYAEPKEGRSLSIFELRSLVTGMSPEGQLRSELREKLIGIAHYNYPYAGEMNCALLASTVLDRLPDLWEQAERLHFDMGALCRQMDVLVQRCAQEEKFAVLLNPRQERLVSDRPLNGMKELSQETIRPDTILQQGNNTCFMLSVLNSMMTTERGRAMLASHLNDDGTMTLLPGLTPEKPKKEEAGFSKLERSLAAAYAHKFPDWHLGSMGIAPEFAAMFGMEEIFYREGSENAVGSIRSAADADTIRQHLEQGRMVLLYTRYHYRAVVGVEGNLIVLRNSLRDGREEKVSIEDLAGGAVSVMEYPR